MLTTEHPWNSTAQTSSLPTYELRLHGGTEDERLIAIPPGKHSVGSGPRCSLRLQYPGVQPLECLIVHDESGLRVRRWSDTTTLNGQSFDDSKLALGDVLTVGPVEMEVQSPRAEASEAEGPWSTDVWDADATPPESETADFEDCPSEDVSPPAVDENVAEHAFELSPQVLQPTGPKLGWEVVEPEILKLADDTAVPVSASGPSSVATEPGPSLSARIRPDRRVRAALHRQRKQYDQLVARVDDLERKIEQAVAEPEVTGDAARGSQNVASEAAAIERDRLQAELESKITQVNEQLAARDRELHQARYSIDVLERQLIDSQRTMHSFAEERLTWESQFNELEARLADYVERIQELERQLDGVRACQSEAAQSAVTPSIEWAAEPPAGQSSNVAEVVTETLSDSADDTSIAEAATWNDTVEEPVVEEVAPVEVSDVAPPTDPAVAESTAEENPGVDAALDHLRGLSIWREESQIAAEPLGEEQTQVADDSPSPATKSPPASFLDRYAHLFPSDDAPADSLGEPAQPLRHVSPPVHESTSAPVATGNEEEESVEQYMAKLLERMRGPANSDTTVEQDAPAEQDSCHTNPPEDSADDEPTPTNQEPITDLAELKTKPTIVEQASRRQAMRELAMQSARHAIGVHASRKLRRSARTRSIIALLGAAVAAYLLITAPGWKSIQFAAACIAGFVALYWGKLTVSTILEGIRLGAFDNYDDEIDADKTIHPPLPIDVEPSLHLEPEANTEAVALSEQESSAEPVERVKQD